MTLLNGAGYCPRCCPLPPCSVHPGQVSSGRCLGCGRYGCLACLPGGRCVNCKAAPKPGKAEAFVVRNIPAGRDRRQILISLVLMFVLVQGGLYLYNTFADPAPASTPAQDAKQRVGLAKSGLDAYLATKKSLPPNAQELADFIATQGTTPPRLVDQEGPADAVIYIRTGNRYELYTLDADGQRVRAGLRD
jgi:hypothetical protein